MASKETIFGIASKYGVTPKALLHANGMTAKSVLSIGKMLRVPDGKLCHAKPAPAQVKSAPVQPSATTTSTPATSTSAPAIPAKSTSIPAPSAPLADPGHDPGKDYVDGMLRENSFLRGPNKKTIQTQGGAQLFFQKGTTVKLINNAGDWIEVEGPAVYKADKLLVDVSGTSKGWIRVIRLR